MHVEGISANRKLGFALLDLLLLCKPFKRVHLVKSSSLGKVRR